MARLVYNNRLNGVVDAKMARKVAAALSQAIAKGYGKSFPKLDFDSPDREMYANLQRQVYHFSFAKNYEQLKATSLALSTGNKVVPFPEFRDIAIRINNEFNARHLRTEYDTGIGSAQMASRWVQFLEDQDTIDMLTYLTVGDANVRNSHAALEGITRKITDAFWSKYYPPNGWGCRCDAVQSPGGKETPEEKIIRPTDVPKMFQTNLATNGLVFPADHPYFEHVPADVLKAADQNNPFVYDQVLKAKKGGSVWRSALHGQEEFKGNLQIAKVIADLGNRVILLPEVKPDNDAQRALRKMVLPDVIKKGKNPDASIDGKLFEFKHATESTQSSIQKAIDKGRKQAEGVVIRVKDDITEAKFKRFVKGKLLQLKTDLPEDIWMIRKGKLTKYTTDEIIKGKSANR